MTDSSLSSILRLTAVPVVIALLSTAAFAQDPPENQPTYQDRQVYSKLGAYIGFAVLPGFTLDGKTFDGVTVYQEVGGEELGFLPRLDKRGMIKFVGGFRNRPFALEISYERVKHEATFFDEFLGDAYFNSVNVDGKFFFNTATRIQPHVLVGLAWPWLNVKDGGVESEAPDARVGDVRWRGPGLNLEGGVTIFANPRAGVSVGYAHRFIWFNRARGVTDTLFELDPPFRETHGNIVILGFFTF